MIYPRRSSWRRITSTIIEIVVDRLVVKPGIEKRLTDSIETVLDLSDGLLVVEVIDGEILTFSSELRLPGLRYQH